MNDHSNWFSSIFAPTSLRTLGVGALGGFLAFWGAESLGQHDAAVDFLAALWSTTLWSGVIGVILGAILLAYDNANSLRGAWYRDLLLALPLFLILGMVGGALGQTFYSLMRLPFLDSITRAGGWALMGAGIGLGIGVLRRDWVQASRGAMGGLLGGFLGGFFFNSLTFISDGGDGALSRLVGLVLTGAAIAFGRLWVQEALKTAWLLGVSTGPYEGKEAPLTKKRVLVGRDASNDIALFRDETVPPQLGALLFEGGVWKWQGGNAQVDGIQTSNAVLKPNSIIEFGAAKFRFLDRSRQDVAPISPAIPLPLPQTPARLILKPVTAGASWPVLELAPGQTEASIGRAPTCDFVVSEATVSSEHAKLFWSSAGLQVRDENSTNGTFINGQKIEPLLLVTLRSGDTLKLGQIEFVAVAS